jgi:hypothetical protein
MSEKFATWAEGVATGTNKTIINVYNGAATPTRRGRLYDVIIGSVATPADQAAKFNLARTTALGTPNTTTAPNNLDNQGPAGELSSGQGTYSVEPTYTSNKVLLSFSLNQRATFRWVANPGSELLVGTTQNNGIALRSVSSTSTQAVESTILFEE